MQEFGDLDRSPSKRVTIPPAPPRPQGLSPRNVVITHGLRPGPTEYFHLMKDFNRSGESPTMNANAL